VTMLSVLSIVVATCNVRAINYIYDCLFFGDSDDNKTFRMGT